MKPHHKPRNVTLTSIRRLTKSYGRNKPTFVPDSAADRAIAGQHLGFEITQRALERIRAGLLEG